MADLLQPLEYNRSLCCVQVGDLRAFLHPFSRRHFGDDMTKPEANHGIIGPIRHVSTLRRHFLAQFFALIPILLVAASESGWFWWYLWITPAYTKIICNLHMMGMVIPMFVEFRQDSSTISLINPPKYYNDWLCCLVLLITCSLYAHIQFYVYYLALISWNFVGKAVVAVVALYPKTVSDAH